MQLFASLDCFPGLSLCSQWCCTRCWSCCSHWFLKPIPTIHFRIKWITIWFWNNLSEMQSAIVSWRLGCNSSKIQCENLLASFLLHLCHVWRASSMKYFKHSVIVYLLTLLLTCKGWSYLLCSWWMLVLWKALCWTTQTKMWGLWWAYIWRSIHKSIKNTVCFFTWKKSYQFLYWWKSLYFKSFQFISCILGQRKGLSFGAFFLCVMQWKLNRWDFLSKLNNIFFIIRLFHLKLLKNSQKINGGKYSYVL